MIQETVPGFEPRWICVTVGCVKGKFPRLDKRQQAGFDLSREQARSKIRRLLALARSTSYPGEAESARALAAELAAKHGLSV